MPPGHFPDEPGIDGADERASVSEFLGDFRFVFHQPPDFERRKILGDGQAAIGPERIAAPALVNQRLHGFFGPRITPYDGLVQCWKF